MRHDAHYVEELSGQRPVPIGRLIAIEQLDPNPEQPRVEIGDLSELRFQGIRRCLSLVGQYHGLGAVGVMLGRGVVAARPRDYVKPCN